MLRYYIRAQYGPYLQESPTDLFEDFYQKILAVACEFIDSRTTAVDIGCATGRLVFEYARLGALKSYGTETSTVFIRFCESLQKSSVSEINYPITGTTAVFLKDDICTSSLPSESFNFISCLNVLDRVTDPSAMIASIERIVASRGIVLIADPYDWVFSPAPKKFHISDVKELLDKDMWEICGEQQLLYRIPISENSYRDYPCPLVIARKR